MSVTARTHRSGESSTSSFTFPGSAHRLPITQVESTFGNNQKAGLRPKSHSSPPGSRMICNTFRPSLTAAVQQTPLLDKALYSDHCHPRPRRARQPSTAKRFDTTQSNQHPTTNKPHNEHSRLRSDHEEDPVGALRMCSVKKQVMRSRSGRARRGSPRFGRDPPDNSLGSHLPVFSRSPLNGGWGAPLTCKELEKGHSSHSSCNKGPLARLPSAAPNAESQAPATDADNVNDVPRPRVSSKRSFWEASSGP